MGIKMYKLLVTKNKSAEQCGRGNTVNGIVIKLYGD